jgi:L-2,4-diaminobutyrate decarboxylase
LHFSAAAAAAAREIAVAFARDVGKKTLMNPLPSAFDPEAFRAQGHRLVDILADRLAKSRRGEGDVCSTVPPEDERRHWEQFMNGEPRSVADFLSEFAGRSIHIHHPRYMGHQVCPPAPSAALAGLASELLNNGMAIYEMGPAATALERWIIERTAAKLGFPEGDGFLTSGGTLAMLTALLAARTRQLGEGTLARGTEVRGAVFASEEAHYCVARAAQVMGWGSEGVIAVPTDAAFKMRVDLLQDRVEEAVRRGLTPIAVVGSAGTTSTGSYDDFSAIADFCAQHDLWFHVDGAHGAAAAFCPELRDRLSGIERADSVILDFHKLLLTPALATAVVFRRRSDSWAAFHQRAQYLWDERATDEWQNIGRRSFECTKLSMSVKIATLWSCHGEELFAENLRAVHGLARTFAQRIRARPRFELAVEPESNIVCFRFRPAGLEELAVDALNAEIRRRIVNSGEYYIVQTVIRGRTWLRTALMNPFTQPEHLEALMDAIETTAARD